MDRHDTAGGERSELVRAMRWLTEVEGRLMCRRDDPHGPDGWVAIVRTPSATGRRSELILGFGPSPVAAVETAQERWDRAWGDTLN